jgi:hypothetical protein
MMYDAPELPLVDHHETILTHPLAKSVGSQYCGDALDIIEGDAAVGTCRKGLLPPSHGMLDSIFRSLDSNPAYC